MSGDLFDTLRRIADPFEALDSALSLCGAAISNDLFTAMRFHAATVEVERLFSTRPDAYPVSGRKPKRDTPWGHRVLTCRKINVGSGARDIAWAFSDHEKILALGLTEVLNVPVVQGSRVRGTLNFLRAAVPFGTDDITTAQVLAAALALRSGHAAL